jgi:hypothetical protein
MRNWLLGAVLLALLATACSNSVGLRPGRTYAVFLRLPSPVISLGADFEADIDLLNLTGEPIEFSFCDGGQYSLTMRDALNRVVFWSPTAVITMPTGFTVPPYGLSGTGLSGTATVLGRPLDAHSKIDQAASIKLQAPDSGQLTSGPGSPRIALCPPSSGTGATGSSSTPTRGSRARRCTCT